MLAVKRYLKRNINISRIDPNRPAEVMLHSAHTKLSLNHISYWIEMFIKSGINFSILLRDISSYKKVTEAFPKHPILYAKTPLEVEMVINKQTNLKSIFYMVNMAKNIHTLRFNHLRHIYIGSENSDQLSVINKSYRAYDEIWVSSQSQIDKFGESVENLGHLKFSIIGKPQLEDIFLNSSKKGEKESILFLPNSANIGNSFIKYMGEILLGVGDCSKFIHLKNMLYIKYLEEFSLNNSLDISLFQSSEFLSDIASQSNFIVVDIGNIKVSLLAYSTPLLIYIPEEQDIENMELDIPIEVLYTFSDHEEFLKIIENLRTRDALKARRDEVTEYLLGKNRTLERKFFEKMME